MPADAPLDARPPAAPALPRAWVRERFPALGRGSVLLDNASGAQLPREALLDLHDALTRMHVNKGGAYAESRAVTEAKERVRERTAAFLGLPAGALVAFGANASTMVELAASSLGATLRDGDALVVTSLDHHANVDPWRRLARRGAEVRTWRPRLPEGRLEPADLRELLDERVRLVAFTAASNALGSLGPVDEAAALVRAVAPDALVCVDAVHLSPHRLPDTAAWDADLVLMSPYKVFAPHLGTLSLSARALERLEPPRLSFLPEGEAIAWEPGTQNHEAIVAFGGALDYLTELGRRVGAPADADGRAAWEPAFAAIARREEELLERLLDGLDAVPVERYGPRGVAGRTATVSFNAPGRTAQETAAALAERGVAVAAGHYYAFDLVMRELGLEARGGAVRASLLHYNDEGDVDALLAALAEIA